MSYVVRIRSSDSQCPAANGTSTNHLLAALLAADLQCWPQDLEPVEMPADLVLHELGQVSHYVYFPTTAIVSLSILLGDGRSTAIAVVGNEGVVGPSLYTGLDRSSCRAMVHSAGRGYRLTAHFIREAFQRNTAVRQLMLRYTHALMTQVSQTAVCNRHHSLDQQVCRLLLLCLDRSVGKELPMTHDLIARLLGVRREGVTGVAGAIQAIGLIQYSRGQIRVLDRGGLVRRACECYAVVKKECTRLLEWPVPAGRNAESPAIQDGEGTLRSIGPGRG
ncbi:MAG: Crp/Fnr family transcriptional regulator [Pseudomonadota bacterium]